MSQKRYRVESDHAEDTASGLLFEPGEWITAVDPDSPYDKAKIDAGRFIPEHGSPAIKATDSAYEKASELGVDLTAVKGTGADGQIKVSDVEAAAEANSSQKEGE